MKKLLSLMAAVGLLLGVYTPAAHAASATFEISQKLEEPIAKVAFTDNSGSTITNPTLAFPMRTASFKCLTAQNGAPTTTFGTSSQKLSISVPDRVTNGWDVSIAPSQDVTLGWNNIENNDALSIDDATDGGCGHTPNNPGFGGLLSVDTTNVHATGVCSTSCEDSFTSPQVGPSTDFAQSPSASIYHSEMSHIGWEGTLTGAILTQTIPAGTPSGTYRLPMTVTLVEL